jgi:Na+-driven multidrug efflux pump
MLQEVTNLAFIGQLNDAAMLVGVGMGNVIINMLGLAVIYGMNMALETLVSQSYGQGNLELCGVYLNRGRFIITLCFIPIAMILTKVQFILTFIG